MPLLKVFNPQDVTDPNFTGKSIKVDTLVYKQFMEEGNEVWWRDSQFRPRKQSFATTMVRYAVKVHGGMPQPVIADRTRRNCACPRVTRGEAPDYTFSNIARINRGTVKGA